MRSKPKSKPKRKRVAKRRVLKNMTKMGKGNMKENKPDKNSKNNSNKPLKRNRSQDSVIYVGTINPSKPISVIDLTKSESTIFQGGRSKKPKFRKSRNRKLAINHLVTIDSAKTCTSSEDCGLMRSRNNIILNADIFDRFNTYYEGERYTNQDINSSSANIELKRTDSFTSVSDLNDFINVEKRFNLEGSEDANLFIENLTTRLIDDVIDSNNLNLMNMEDFNIEMNPLTGLYHVESIENFDTSNV